MKIKYLLLFCFLLLIRISFSQTSPTYNLLWKIEGNGMKKPSYLFGTMHVTDNRAFRFSDSVMTAIEKCSAFALELHPDSLMRELFNEYLSKDKTHKSLKELLSEDQYNKINKQFEEQHGYPLDRINTKNPLIIRHLLERKKPAASRQTFVDAYLLGISRTLDKKIYGLEQTKSQLDFLSTFSEETMKQKIIDMLDPDEEHGSELERLTQLYATGNIYEIEKAVVFPQRTDSLMIFRNKTMVSSMIRLMEQQTLFTAVGVAHLPGKEGIIKLLEEKGYKLSPVKASFTGVADRYKIDYARMKWVPHNDSLTGYSLQAPGGLIPADIYPGLDTYLYTDITNSMVYGIYTIHMGESDKKNPQEDLINTIVNNYKQSKKTEIIKNKTFERNGLTMNELVIKTSSSGYLRMQLLVKNTILYCLFVGNSADHIKSENAERFFNSFQQFRPRAQKDPKWVDFSVPKGAFSVQLPSQPKNISRLAGSEEEGNSYQLNMYLSTSFKSMSNYIVRYNDYPIGMYINSNEQIFNVTRADFEKSGKLLSEPDTIWRDNCEGREYKMLLQDKYYTLAHLYLRGNRVYILLKQRLSAEPFDIKEDNFFSSFTFEPYQENEKYVYRPEDGSFEMQLPSAPKVVPDTLSYSESTSNTMDLYSANPSSGGLFQLEYSTLGTFFRLTSLKSFYNKFLKSTMSYGDSIFSSDSVTVNGYYAQDYLVGKNGENSKRMRVWIAGDKLFYFCTYAGKEELFSQHTNTFYNSFRYLSTSTFDLYSSRSKKITEDLASSDSSLFKPAFSALKYYDFTAEDLPMLIKVLERPDHTGKADHTKYFTVKAIEKTGEASAIPQLAKIYQQMQTNDETRAQLLNTLVNLNPSRGMAVYLDLLTHNRTLHPESGSWIAFSPFYDSLEFAKDNFQRILPLADSAQYKSNVLTLALRLAEDDSSHTFLPGCYRPLTKNAAADLENFRKQVALDKENTDDTPMFKYLSLSVLQKDQELINTLSTGILESANASDYLKNRAIIARIQSHLPVNKSELRKQMKDLAFRHDILKAYQDLKQFESIDKSYRKPEEMGKMFLYVYLGEDDGYPDKIKTLGEIQRNDSLFYVYAFSFKTEEKTKTEYLGISGPFKKDQTVFDFDKYNAYASWKEKTKSWREESEELIRVMAE